MSERSTGDLKFLHRVLRITHQELQIESGTGLHDLPGPKFPKFV